MNLSEGFIDDGSDEDSLDLQRSVCLLQFYELILFETAFKDAQINESMKAVKRPTRIGKKGSSKNAATLNELEQLPLTEAYFILKGDLYKYLNVENLDDVIIELATRAALEAYLNFYQKLSLQDILGFYFSTSKKHELQRRKELEQDLTSRDFDNVVSNMYPYDEFLQSITEAISSMFVPEDFVREEPEEEAISAEDEIEYLSPLSPEGLIENLSAEDFVKYVGSDMLGKVLDKSGGSQEAVAGAEKQNQPPQNENQAVLNVPVIADEPKEMNGQSEPQARRKKTPWTEYELQLLEKGILEFGRSSWQKILDKYGKGAEGFLQSRTGVDLKDKARVEKRRRVKMNMNLGVYANI